MIIEKGIMISILTLCQKRGMLFIEEDLREDIKSLEVGIMHLQL